MMPILSLLPILCVCEKSEFSTPPSTYSLGMCTEAELVTDFLTIFTFGKEITNTN